MVKRRSRMAVFRPQHTCLHAVHKTWKGVRDTESFKTKTELRSCLSSVRAPFLLLLSQSPFCHCVGHLSLPHPKSDPGTMLRSKKTNGVNQRSFSLRANESKNEHPGAGLVSPTPQHKCGPVAYPCFHLRVRILQNITDGCHKDMSNTFMWIYEWRQTFPDATLSLIWPIGLTMQIGFCALGYLVDI